jgi:hypothetical protein
MADATDLKSVPASSQHLSKSTLTTTPQKTLLPSLPVNLQNDPDFHAVTEAWPKLSAAIRAGIVALIRAANKGV